jgi:hypothetical protein
MREGAGVLSRLGYVFHLEAYVRFGTRELFFGFRTLPPTGK